MLVEEAYAELLNDHLPIDEHARARLIHGQQPDRPDCRYYEPLNQRSLARILSRLDISEDPVLEFAERYGQLGTGKFYHLLIDGLDHVHLPQSVLSVLSATNTDRLPYAFRAESLADWARQIQALREAFCLWDMVVADDRQSLSELIDWETDDRVVYVSRDKKGLAPERRVRLADAKTNPGILGTIPRRSVIGPARLAIHYLVNSNTQDSVTVRLDLDIQNMRSTQSPAPTSLIGALWMQVINEILGTERLAHCIRCGKPFQYRRKTAKFCSAECRMLFHSSNRSSADGHRSEGAIP